MQCIAWGWAAFKQYMEGWGWMINKCPNKRDFSLALSQGGFIIRVRLSVEFHLVLTGVFS